MDEINEMNEIPNQRHFHDANAAAPKPKQTKKLRHSNFLLTINTNTVYKNDPESEKLLALFEPVIKHITQDMRLNELIEIVKPGDTFNKATIKNYLVDAKPEVGPKDGKLHAHILISVQHYTLVRLRIAFLKDYIKNALGENAPYVYYKLYPERAANNIDYILQTYVRKGAIAAGNVPVITPVIQPINNTEK